jgi:two-component system CheB/CheR fusion protein
LAAAFKQALKQETAVTRTRLKVKTDGKVRAVDLSVQAIRDTGALQGMVLVVFTDSAVPAVPKASSRGGRPVRSAVAALEQELEDARIESRRARETMQTVQEELRSAHEDLQSANEELQSTNEELTTSKEEMQSMNEELQTLNRELEARVEDLSRLASDMRNLMNSTDIATVFLDAAMSVRLYTLGSNRIFKLIPGDVGRPLADIASQLDYPALIDDAREVLRVLAIHEQPVRAHDGRWYQARIMPYRTTENVIDGVVLTFSDITAAKVLETELRHAQVDMARRISEQDVKLEEAQDRQAAPARPAPGTST